MCCRKPVSPGTPTRGVYYSARHGPAYCAASRSPCEAPVSGASGLRRMRAVCRSLTLFHQISSTSLSHFPHQCVCVLTWFFSCVYFYFDVKMEERVNRCHVVPLNAWGWAQKIMIINNLGKKHVVRRESENQETVLKMKIRRCSCTQFNWHTKRAMFAISLRAYVCARVCTCAQPFVLFSSYIIGVCNICFDSSFQLSVKTLLLSTKLVYELPAVFIIRRRSSSSKVSFAKDRSLQRWRKVDENIFLEHTVAAYYSVRVLSLRLPGWRDLLPLILFVL